MDVVISIDLTPFYLGLVAISAVIGYALGFYGQRLYPILSVLSLFFITPMFFNPIVISRIEYIISFYLSGIIPGIALGNYIGYKQYKIETEMKLLMQKVETVLLKLETE